MRRRAASVQCLVRIVGSMMAIFPDLTSAFLPLKSSPAFLSLPAPHPQRKLWVKSEEAVDGLESDTPEAPPVVLAVVAPLRYKGPYASLSLNFNFDKKPGETTLHFILDTGANVNTLHDKVVRKLDLPLVMSSQETVGAVGMGGKFAPSNVYMLGECKLDGLPPEQDFTFMTNLTAASLPNAPGGVCHGLLGVLFFHSFPAGVSFEWYGTDGDPPTMTFYAGPELPDIAKPGLKRVSLQRLPTQLLSLTVRINNSTQLLALLDTGSPVTILSPHAAELANIATVPVDLSKGNVVVGGVDGGRRIQLHRSKSPVLIEAGDDDDKVSLGQRSVFVGDLPGMAYLAGLEDTSNKPNVILGLDFLKQTYRMVLRASSNEVWFEELGNQMNAPSK